MKAILERRSVRSFTSEPVSPQHLQTLLRAAMRAPSARNQQPWEFLVLQNRETLEAITDFHPYAVALKSAPCGILICADRNRVSAHPDTWVMDCSAATQNLLLEAVHLELGAVWLTLHPYPDRLEGVRKLLKLPEHILPLCIVAVGHPEKQPEPMDTFLPERIHYENWD